VVNSYKKEVAEETGPPSAKVTAPPTFSLLKSGQTPSPRTIMAAYPPRHSALSRSRFGEAPALVARGLSLKRLDSRLCAFNLRLRDSQTNGTITRLLLRQLVRSEAVQLFETFDFSKEALDGFVDDSVGLTISRAWDRQGRRM
jgi:hypothetical protein